MKNLILLFFILFSLKVIGKEKIGYLVVVSQGKEHISSKVLTLEEVKTISEVYFPENCINFTEEFKKSKFIEIRTELKEFYAETKRIKRIRNGKLILRSMRRKY